MKTTSTPEIAEIAEKARAWACYDCGKCTATCPIARVGGALSPRRQVLAANLGHREDIITNNALFACLTCGLCSSRCPAEVDYCELVLNLRQLAFHDGIEPECPHGGALQSMMRMMAKGKTKQDRLSWLTKDLKVQHKKGDVFYWTGCTMYYDAFFPDFNITTLDATRAAIRVLNRLGVTPVVSPDERCCGHDLLWNGDRENFELLARHNVKLVESSGAKTLVISCAECLQTWKVDYQPFFETSPPKIMHITEFMQENLDNLKFKANKEHTVTYQDPCRLGRHLGIFDPPRAILEALPDITLEEMPRSGKNSICCAGATWSNCDRYAKHIQVDRLREAKSTGAKFLVTSCPKCQIHFACAMKDPNLHEEIEIPMRDIATLVADALAD